MIVAILVRVSTVFVLLAVSTTTIQAQIHFDEDHHHRNNNPYHRHHHQHHDRQQVRRGLRDRQRQEQHINNKGLFQKLLLNQSITELNDDNRSICGTRDPTSEEMTQSLSVIQKWMSNIALRNQQQQRQRLVINIPTYFHVIYGMEIDFASGVNITFGVISDDTLQDQLSVLNDAFRPYGFTFTLMGITRTENYDWYYASDYSDEDYDMRNTLRVGDASTLNVYFNDAAGTYGYATPPFWYTENPKLDGVAVLSYVVPGGDIPSKNEGKTLIHEVGHWLGLYHVFQVFYKEPPFWFVLFERLFERADAWCYYSNDFVADTPKQGYPTYGCPERSDSCPLRRGLDSIHNYMDYSDDVCCTEFTTGQMDRMQAMWYEYRASSV